MTAPKSDIWLDVAEMGWITHVGQDHHDFIITIPVTWWLNIPRSGMQIEVVQFIISGELLPEALSESSGGPLPPPSAPA